MNSDSGLITVPNATHVLRYHLILYYDIFCLGNWIMLSSLTLSGDFRIALSSILIWFVFHQDIKACIKDFQKIIIFWEILSIRYEHETVWLPLFARNHNHHFGAPYDYNKFLPIQQLPSNPSWNMTATCLQLVTCYDGRGTERGMGRSINMMTWLNGTIFRVTGLLCGEFTGHRWILRTKTRNAELWCFLWSASE